MPDLCISRSAYYYQGCGESAGNYQQFKIPFRQIAQVALALLASKSDFIIAIDQSNWKFEPLEINILLAAVVYRATAFPLLWMLIDKKGNSNTTERIQLMEQL